MTLKEIVSASCNRLLRLGAWNPELSMSFIVFQAKLLGELPIRGKVKAGGSTQHYYHFLFDLLLPLDIMLSRYPGDYRIALPDCGPFNKICKHLYGDRVVTWDENEDYHNVARANLLGMEPLRTDPGQKNLAEFRSRMINRVGVEASRELPRVLVIERSAPGEFYKSEHSTTKSTGTQRRSIPNHQDMLACIRSIFEPQFQVQNVILEDIAFDEQIKLFAESSVIIGQHGAGLANQIWANPGSTLIEIRQDDKKDHFKRLAMFCDHRYVTFYVHSDHPTIDITQLEQSLRENQDVKSLIS